MAHPAPVRLSFIIERDDDCDCPRWLRWRIVLLQRCDGRGTRTVVKHTVTRVGARLARWRRQRDLERAVEDELRVLV